MQRYFYYLVLVNMLVNIMVFVPKILLDQRFGGATLALLLAVPVGTLFMWLFMRSLAQFPCQGLPEIMQAVLPGYLRTGFLLFFTFMWFAAGGLTLAVYAQALKKFVSPDISDFMVILTYVVLVIFIASGKSTSVLYCAEMILILNLPFVIWILYKALANDQLKWDAMQDIVTQLPHFPTWTLLAAATYLFSGYTNMAIFNRTFSRPIVHTRPWAVALVGFIVLLTTFFLPIGFQGTAAVIEYPYPWISTADSMRIELGIIERMVFLFLILYVGISLTSSFIIWHVGTELAKSLIRKETFRERIFPWIILGAAGIATIVAERYMNLQQIFTIGTLWLKLRLAAEALLAGLMVYMARKAKGKSP